MKLQELDCLMLKHPQYKSEFQFFSTLTPRICQGYSTIYYKDILGHIFHSSVINCTFLLRKTFMWPHKIYFMCLVVYIKSCRSSVHSKPNHEGGNFVCYADSLSPGFHWQQLDCELPEILQRLSWRGSIRVWTGQCQHVSLNGELPVLCGCDVTQLCMHRICRVYWRGM